MCEIFWFAADFLEKLSDENILQLKHYLHRDIFSIENGRDNRNEILINLFPFSILELIPTKQLFQYLNEIVTALNQVQKGNQFFLSNCIRFSSYKTSNYT